MTTTVTAVATPSGASRMPLPDPGARGREAWAQSLQTPRQEPRSATQDVATPVLDFSRLIDVYA